MAISIDDRRLVEAHKAGDPAAFADLVRNHHNALMGHAVRRLHDRQAAEDAVQETLLRAYRALPRFNGDYKVAGWLHRILENVCADEGNRRKRESLTIERVTGAERFVEPGIDQVIGLDLPAAEVAAALSRLPRNYQEALVLRFVDELPYDEVALAAGVSEDNARARVHRARVALRRALGTVAAFTAFLIPFGRKPGKALAATAAPPADPATATTAATATNAASAASTGLAAQLAPFAAEVANGSSLAAHKLAMAIGLAAAVAVPSGVHLSQSRASDAPPVTAPVPPAGAEAPESGSAAAPKTSSEPGTLSIAGLNADGSETITSTEGGASDTDSDDATGTGTSGAAPSTSTGSGDSGTDDATDPATTPVDDATADPRGASLVATDLRVSEAGPRLTIDGSVELTTDDATVAGTITGRAQVSAAAPKDPDEPRRFDTLLTVTLEDDRTFDVRLVGLATVTDGEDGERIYAIEGTYELVGADDVAIDPTGDFTAHMVHDAEGGGSFELTLGDGPSSSAASESADGEVFGDDEDGAGTGGGDPARS